MGAVDAQGRLTTIGKAMGSLPLHPRLAHMLLRADGPGARTLACDLAALLSERDILKSSRTTGHSTDIEHRLVLLDHWRETAKGGAQDQSVDRQGVRRLDRVSRQFHKLLETQPLPRTGGLHSAAGLLAMAYPDRIGKLTRHGRFQLASGRGATMAEDDNLAGAGFLVAAQLDAGRTQGRIQLAVAISETELRELPDLPLLQVESVVWDNAQQAVLALQEERLGALRLAAKPCRMLIRER